MVAQIEIRGSSDRYMIHLYCLAVQPGFYSDAVECSPVTQAARVQCPVAALVIRIFSDATEPFANSGDPDLTPHSLRRLIWSALFASSAVFNGLIGNTVHSGLCYSTLLVPNLVSAFFINKLLLRKKVYM